MGSESHSAAGGARPTVAAGRGGPPGWGQHHGLQRVAGVLRDDNQMVGNLFGAGVSLVRQCDDDPAAL